MVQFTDVVSDVNTFSQQWKEELDKKGYEIANEILGLRKDDIKWRLHGRKKYARIIIWLLIIQNALIFVLVYWAFANGRLSELQWLFAILVPATLTETAATVHIIVTWLFKDIEYPLAKS